jgi:hypothetical protein
MVVVMLERERLERRKREWCRKIKFIESKTHTSQVRLVRVFILRHAYGVDTSQPFLT